MPDEPQDETSEIVAARLRETQKILSDAERIFNEETTAQHRAKWSNVYRLESATEHAQKILALADPRITQVGAAEEVEDSATQARDAIRAAVDSGGGGSHWLGRPAFERNCADRNGTAGAGGGEGGRATR